MTQVTCRLTAKYRDQLRNPTLGNRVWATFTIFSNVVVPEKAAAIRAIVSAVSSEAGSDSRKSVMPVFHSISYFVAFH